MSPLKAMTRKVGRYLSVANSIEKFEMNEEREAKKEKLNHHGSADERRSLSDYFAQNHLF